MPDQPTDTAANSVPAAAEALRKEPDSLVFQRAFLALHQEMADIPSKDLGTLNIDVVSVTARVFVRLPDLRGLSAQAEEVFRAFDRRIFDRLEKTAQALRHAVFLYASMWENKLAINKLLPEAREVREELVDDLKILLKREVILTDLPKHLRRGNGPQHMSTDLQALTGFFREQWARVQHRTGLREADLARAEVVTWKLHDLVVARVQAAKSLPKVVRERAAAFTLFSRAYDEVRRFVTFLRWRKDDADEFMPALFLREKRKKREKKSDEIVPLGPAFDATRLGAAPVIEGELVGGPSIGAGTWLFVGQGGGVMGAPPALAVAPVVAATLPPTFSQPADPNAASSPKRAKKRKRRRT